jgi:competence CoiA-like predicted nuclease
MQYAMVNGKAVEASPDLEGTCGYCKSPMIAKCGQFKMRHWAHKSKVSCDPWWESEKQWHRDWKSNFPIEWREYIIKNEDEKHIADTRTNQGIVVEFQHSPLDPEDMKAREKFYGKMIWIVDGCRQDSNKLRFYKEHSYIAQTPLTIQFHWGGGVKMFDYWAQSTKTVYIDFGDYYLWRLISYERVQAIEGKRYLVQKGKALAIAKNSLIKCLVDGNYEQDSAQLSDAKVVDTASQAQNVNDVPSQMQLNFGVVEKDKN